MDIVDLGFRVDSGDLARASREMDTLDRAGQRTTGTTAGLLSGFTGMAAAASAAAGALGIGALIGSTNDYVDALAEVSTLVDTTAFDMDKLSDAALSQSREFGTMPTANVQAFYQAISAGASSAAEATDAMETAQRLAVGGVTEVLTAIDGLTSSMNAYGDEAGSFTDIADGMFVAVRAGKTTIDELSGSIGKLAPLSATAGASLDEVLAATAALTKGGVATNTAMDGLRAIMAAIVKPTKEAADLAADLGLGFDAAALQTKGFAGFLEDLVKKTGGATEDLAVLFGGVEALTPILALTGGASEDFAEILESMGDKAGEAQLAFEKMVNSPGFQSQRIVSSLAAGFTELGKGIAESAVPALRSIADAIPVIFGSIETTINAFTGVWDSFIDKLTGAGSLEAALSKDYSPFYSTLRSIGDVIKDIGVFLGPVIPYMDDFAVALVAVAGTALGVGAVAAALGLVAAVTLNPVSLAIGGIAAGAVLLRNNWDGISSWWAGLWSGLDGDVLSFSVRLISSLTDMAGDFIQAGLTMASDFVSSLGDGVRNSLSGIEWPTGAQITAAAMNMTIGFGLAAIDMAASFIDKLSAGIKGSVSDVEWPSATQLVASANSMVVGFASVAAESVAALIVGVTQGVSTLASSIEWPSAADFISRAGQLIGAFGTIALSANLELLSGVMNGMRTLASNIEWPSAADIGRGAAQMVIAFGQLAASAAGALVNGISNLVKDPDIEWPTTTQIVDSAFNLIQGFIFVANAAFAGFMSELYTGLEDTFDNIQWPTIGEIMTGAVELLAGYFNLGVSLVAAVGRGVLGIGVAVVDGFKAGLSGVARELAFALADMIEDMPLLGPMLADKLRAAGAEGSEGLEIGLRDGEQAVAKASEDVTATIEETARVVLDSKSPSRALMRVGLDASMGLAIGITDGTAEVQKAAGLATTAAVNEFQRLTDGLLLQRIELVSGEEAAQRYGLALKGITGDAADTIIATERFNQALDQQLRLQERVDGVLKDLAIEHAILTTELTQGADAAEMLKHQVEGYSEADARLAVDLKRSNELLREQTEIRRELSNGIKESIVNADSVKDAFSNLGDFMTDWLKQKVAEFAANQIMVFLGLGDAGFSDSLGAILTSAGSVVQQFGGYVETAGSAVSTFGKSVDGSFGEMLTGAGSAISSFGSTVSGMFTGVTGTASTAATAITASSEAGMGAAISASQASTAAIVEGSAAQVAASEAAGVAATESAASISSAGGGWASTAASAAGAAVAAYFLGEALGDLLGAANSTAVGVGAALGAALGSIVPVIGTYLGGALGAAVGSAFGGAWQKIETGFELAFTGGELVGLSYEYFEKERSMWRGTATDLVESELEPTIKAAVLNYWSRLTTSIVNSAELLGIAGAENIFDSFEVAMTNFSGKGAEEKFELWMAETSLQAYETLYNNLGPAMTEAVSDVVITVNDEVTSIGDAFAGSGFLEMLNEMESLDFENMELTGKSLELMEEAAAKLGLTLEELQSFFGEVNTAASNLAPLMEAAGFSMSENLDEAAASAFNFSQMVGGSENAINILSGIMTDLGMDAELTGARLKIAQNTVDDFNESALNVSGSVTLLNDDYNSMFDELQALGPAGQQAASVIGQFVTGVDAVTGAVTINYDGLRKLVNEAIVPFSEHNTELMGILNNVIGDIGVMGEAFVDMDGNMITTTQGVFDYIIAIQEMADAGIITTEAAGQAIEQALLAVPAIQQLEQDLARQALVLSTVSDAAVRLNLNFDSMDPKAQAASESLVTLMGGLESFTASVGDYYDKFFSAEEKTQITLVESAAAVSVWQQEIIDAGGSAITSKEQFRDYVNSLDLTTASGQLAFESAMRVAGSFDVVVGSGDGLMDIISLIPPHLQGAFFEMAGGAEALGIELPDLLDQTWDGLLGGAEELGELLPPGLQVAWDTIVAGAEQLSKDAPENVQGGFDLIMNGAAAMRDLLPPELQDAWDEMFSSTDQFGENLPPFLQSMWDAMVGNAEESSNEIEELAKKIHGSSVASVESISLVDAAFIETSGTLVAVDEELGATTYQIGESFFTLVTDMNGNVSVIRGSASDLDTQLGRVGGALSGTASAASSAFGTLNNLISQGLIMNSDQLAAAGFASGLDRVPVAEMPAIVHQDEMIVRADVAEQLRGMGVTATSLGPLAANAPFAGTVNVTAPRTTVQGDSSNNDDVVAAIKEQNKLLEKIVKATMTSGSAVTSQQQQAVKVLTQVKDEVYKQRRETAA